MRDPPCVGAAAARRTGARWFDHRRAPGRRVNSIIAAPGPCFAPPEAVEASGGGKRTGTPGPPPRWPRGRGPGWVDSVLPKHHLETGFLVRFRFGVFCRFLFFWGCFVCLLKLLFVPSF